MKRNRREIFYGSEASAFLQEGVNTLANAVKVTLGPAGKNVIISRQVGEPEITKDGVTVARNVMTDDARVNVAIKSVRSSAERTDELAGDGTTSNLVLLQAIYNAGLEQVKKGANVTALKRGMEFALDQIVKLIDENKIDVADKLEAIATISANNDEVLGKLVSEVFTKVGSAGIVTVEDSGNTQTEYKIAEGISFERGYCSPYMVNTKEGKVVLRDTTNGIAVFIYNGRLTQFAQIESFLDYVFTNSFQFLIIAEDIEGEALNVIVSNIVQGKLRGAAVKAPGYGDYRMENMEDIAVAVGCEVFDITKGHGQIEFDVEKFVGLANYVELSKDDTTIIDGAGTSEDIKERVETLKLQMESLTDDDYEKNKLKERIARLTNGLAVIYVGAYTEVELIEKKSRLTDTIAATKAALLDGIVPGGGNMLSYINKLLQEPVEQKFEQGYRVVIDSLLSPAKTIAINSGMNPEEYIGLQEFNKGYDARECTSQINLIESGIVDPAKITKTAISNAVSVASMLLTTECLLVDSEHASDYVPIDPLG